MKIHLTKQAESSYRKLPLQIKKKVDKQLALLLSNYRHPSLRARKMGGTGHYEARVDRRYRFTFVVDDEEIFVLTVGPYDEGLGKN